MERNVGTVDRWARIAVGLVAALAGVPALTGFRGPGRVLGAVALVVGAVLVVTGTTRKCPLYAGVGLTTAADRR